MMDIAMPNEAIVSGGAPRQPAGDKRLELRDFYFDSLAPGQSTDRFWTELKTAIHYHDAALRDLSRVRIVEETA